MWFSYNTVSGSFKYESQLFLNSLLVTIILNRLYILNRYLLKEPWNPFQTFFLQLTSTVVEWWCRREGSRGIRRSGKECRAVSRPSRKHSSRKKSICSTRDPITWSSPPSCTLKEYKKVKFFALIEVLMDETQYRWFELNDVYEE